MQRLCGLAGVIAAVTFSSGVSAALIRMDDSPHAGKDSPVNTARAGATRASPQTSQAGFAPAGMQGRGAAYNDAGLVAVMPSFIDLVGGALRRDELSFDGSAHLARRSSGESWHGESPRAAAGDRAPLAAFNPPVHSGWSNNSDYLVGQALAAAPEASTTGLLLTGLGLLWLLRRRNHRLQEVAEEAADVTQADRIMDADVEPRERAVVTLSGEFGGRLRLPRSSPPRLGRLRRQAGTPSISIRRLG